MKAVREPRKGYGEGRATANITLSLPKDLKEELAALARKRGLSVNALMLGVIENLVRGEVRPMGADFVALARALTASKSETAGDGQSNSREPYKWNREDAYRGKRFGDSD